MPVGELGVEARAQRSPTGCVTTDTNIGNEQVCERAEIAVVEQDRVARSQLADLFARDQPGQRIRVSQRAHRRSLSGERADHFHQAAELGLGVVVVR